MFGLLRKLKISIILFLLFCPSISFAFDFIPYRIPGIDLVKSYSQYYYFDSDRTTYFFYDGISTVYLYVNNQLLDSWTYALAVRTLTYLGDDVTYNGDTITYEY